MSNHIDILDSKFYNSEDNKFPQTGDIGKQILYRDYIKRIADDDIVSISNNFIFPKKDSNNKISYIGIHLVEDIEDYTIKCWELDIDYVLNCFVNGESSEELFSQLTKFENDDKLIAPKIKYIEKTTDTIENTDNKFTKEKFKYFIENEIEQGVIYTRAIMAKKIISLYPKLFEKHNGEYQVGNELTGNHMNFNKKTSSCNQLIEEGWCIEIVSVKYDKKSPMVGWIFTKKGNESV